MENHKGYLSGIYSEEAQLQDHLLDKSGLMQISTVVKAYGLGARLVLSGLRSSEDPENFAQGTVIELLHSYLVDEKDRWRTLGLTYMELVSLDFCLDAARDSLGHYNPRRERLGYDNPKVEIVKILSRDRGIPQLESNLVNLGRYTFDQKFDELFELLPVVFLEALAAEQPFATGAPYVDAYVADMITTLKSMKGI